MGLKQDITVMNEFSAHGSRGRTTAQYLLRYIVRDGATETLEPIRRTDIQDFTTRYVVRADAIDSAPDVPEAKRRMWNAQKWGGVGFGYGSLSLSDEALRRAAADQQALQNAGKTILKTVISFDQDYLERMGIVEPGFVCEKKGDYRGHIDQMKLRQAVSNGMRRISHEFDELRWSAGIQVDTTHVHCHLVMVDAGVGTLMPNGEQKGKLTQKTLDRLKRGVDAYLDRNQQVHHLSSAVAYERRNVTTYVKRWAHQQVVNNTLPQLLVACLPADKRLWRAGTHRKEMEKANTLLREVVEDSLSRSGSPMHHAMGQVERYAQERTLREELSDEQRDALVARGREDIVTSSMNAVYAQLRRIPDDHLVVRTDLLTAVGASDDEQAGAERAREVARVQRVHDELVDIAEFGRRLSSWSARLAEHRSRQQDYRALAQGWHAADAAGNADPTSRAMLEMYEAEQDYESRCVSKYLHLMPLQAAEQERARIWSPVAEHAIALQGLEALVSDDSLRKLADGDEAEERGQQAYGQRGGRLMTQGATGKEVLNERLRRMRLRHEAMVHDAVVELASHGLVLAPGVEEEDLDEEEPAVVEGTVHDFEDVRGIDLHRLRFDYLEDEPVGERVLEQCREVARRRSEAAQAALDYLERTGQDELVELVPVDDIADMVSTVERVEASGHVLPSEAARLRELEVNARSATLHLDDDRMPNLSREVDESADQVVREVLAQLETMRLPAREQRMPGR